MLPFSNHPSWAKPCRPPALSSADPTSMLSLKVLIGANLWSASCLVD
jgi:hypothetical protein